VSIAFSQGELIMVDFNPSAGHEPQKRRPAAVVSTGRFNVLLSSLTVVCPSTSTDNSHPLHIKIADGSSVAGFICVEQMRSIDCGKRNAKSLDAKLDFDTMDKVLTAIGATFGI
jgi:mRNA interferase MazF